MAENPPFIAMIFPMKKCQEILFWPGHWRRPPRRLPLLRQNLRCVPLGHQRFQQQKKYDHETRMDLGIHFPVVKKMGITCLLSFFENNVELFSRPKVIDDHQDSHMVFISLTVGFRIFHSWPAA